MSAVRNIRATLQSGDRKTLETLRQLGVYADWPSFLAASQENISKPSISWLKAVAAESQAYLEQLELMSPCHKIAIDRLKAGASIARVSHQPNLFAALNINGLSLLAAELAEARGGVAVFISIDYDEAGDQRFRGPLLPPTTGTKSVYLHGAVPVDQRRTIALSIEKPALKDLRRWTELHIQTATYWCRQLSLPKVKPNILRSMPVESYLAKANSLTEFNLALVAHYAKEVFDLDILVVPASKLLPYLSDEINQVARDLLICEPRCKANLVWRVCETCFQRCPTKLEVGGRLTVTWSCSRCSVSASETLDWSRTFLCHTGPRPAFVPKVTLCDTIDFKLACSGGSISYAGGLEHIFTSRLLARKAQIPLLPEFIWEPDHMNFMHTTEASEQWASGKFSAFIYSDTFGREQVVSKIRQSL